MLSPWPGTCSEKRKDQDHLRRRLEMLQGRRQLKALGSSSGLSVADGICTWKVHARYCINSLS